jgi:hypothetical protein
MGFISFRLQDKWCHLLGVVVCLSRRTIFSFQADKKMDQQQLESLMSFHGWRQKLDIPMVKDVLDLTVGPRQMQVLKSVVTDLYNDAYEHKVDMTGWSATDMGTFAVLMARNVFSASKWRTELRTSILSVLSAMQSTTRDQPSPAPHTGTLIAEVIRALSESGLIPTPNAAVGNVSGPIAKVENKKKAVVKCEMCGARKGRCGCVEVITTKRNQPKSPSPRMPVPRVVVAEDEGDDDDDDGEDDHDGEGDDDDDEPHDDEPQDHSALNADNPKFLLDASQWPDLLQDAGLNVTIEALRTYYNNCMASRSKESQFLLALATIFARIIDDPNQAQRYAQTGITRIITRFEYFQGLHSRGPSAAEAVESTLLDNDLPKHLRAARRAGEKRYVEVSKTSQPRPTQRQPPNQPRRGAARGRGGRGSAPTPAAAEPAK